MRVELMTVPAQRVGAVRHTGAYWKVGMAFDELGRRTTRLGLKPGPMVAAFYDDAHRALHAHRVKGRAPS